MLIGWWGISGSEIGRAAYTNLEWLAPLFIVAAVGVLWLGAGLSSVERRYINHLPPDAQWWEYVLTGFIVVPMAIALGPLLLLMLVAVAAVLPYKLIAEYILASAPTMAKVVASIPVVIGGIGVLIALAIVSIIEKGKGSLVGEEGALLTARHQGGTGVGPRDLLSVYYFSCLAFLGAGFGEYKPTGYCRTVTLFAVVCGRLLEVVVIGISANVLASTFGP
jgi:hypothetical protein